MPVRVLIFALVFATAGCAAKRQTHWDAAVKEAPEAAEEQTLALAREAEALWEKREDPEALRGAIGRWEALVELTGDARVHTRLSRAWYFLADAHLRKGGTTSAPYLEAFEKGIAAGERALGAGNPEFKRQVTSGTSVEKAIAVIGKDEAEAAYWYATNLGKWARAKGFATTLANKDKVKAVMDRVLAVDEDLFHGAPDRYFGAFYAVAPGFAGGDMVKSREHFEKSLLRAPDYVGTKVLMADTYAAKLKDRALFERLLDEVLATADDVLPGLEPETRAEKEKAREMKAQIDELL
jgi:tetratricopeptide (TPR) repeat protein